MVERWRHTWPDLVEQVLDPGLCTGCAACVIACPQHVLDLDQGWVPRLASEGWADENPDRCRFGERGCTLCSRVCSRFGAWESDADLARWSRTRKVDELIGFHRRMLLVEATDPRIAAVGQDGGVGTALLLFAIENDYIDAALVSYVDEGMRTRPGLARNRTDLLASAGSRYTYSPNLLAYSQTTAADEPRLGLISVGCQTSAPAVAQARGARKLSKRFTLVVGLLCSRTFTEPFYADLLEARYGVARHLITKVNIKGRLQVWYENGGSDPSYLEVPLSECREFTRPGCLHCPDFAAQHADLSLGGIGKNAGKTLVISRSELAEEILNDMEHNGWITVTDALKEDPDAISLIRKLAAQQRRRWPISTGPRGGPAILPTEV